MRLRYPRLLKSVALVSFFAAILTSCGGDDNGETDNVDSTAVGKDTTGAIAVSYTHLTLPTNREV